MEIRNHYYCDSCPGPTPYVYDPKDWNDVDLDDQPDEWVCPTCQATKDHLHLVVPATYEDETPEDEDGEYRLGGDIDVGERRLYYKRSDPDVARLKRRYEQRTLDPQPFFQRYEVWTPKKKSRFIESLLLGLPVPYIFLAEDEVDKKTSVVIDGQQRLMSLFEFLSSKSYALTGVPKSWAGKKYGDLGDEGETLLNYEMPVITIGRESDPEIKFLLFRRLNEGATSLNDQELRNCIYRGRYNDFVKNDLARIPGWRKILRLKGNEPHKRMADVELALRYLAFRDQGYDTYPDKKTSEFLNRQMTRNLDPRDEKEFQKYSKAAEADFKQAVALTLSVFGEKHAGRRFVAGDAEKPDGRWDARLNRALLDVVLWGFKRYSKGNFIKHADEVREAAIDLMSNPIFANLVMHTISEKRRVERRFDMWKVMLDSVLAADSVQGPRLFPRSVKEKLFEKDQTCDRCHNKIHDIDDAHVDHIVPWTKGGRTTTDNGRLLHRFCNQSIGSTEPGDR